MKITIKTLAIGLAAVALMAATSVQASWSSYWTLPGPIDALTGTISAGGAFAIPGYEAEQNNFPAWPTPLLGWTSANGVNTASMSGPSQTGNFYYWINVSTAITQSFTIDQWYWSGGIAVGHDIITYDGSGTIIPVGDTIPGTDIVVENHPFNNAGFTVESAPVPEPTTLIAGALLLLPFGASTLRMFRKTRTA